MKTFCFIIIVGVVSFRTTTLTAQQCGGSSLIIQDQGDTIQPGEFPWLVALMYQLQNIDYRYLCRGSLVTNRHVITAAHCVHFGHTRIKPIEDLIVVLGRVSLKHWAKKAVFRNIISYIVHPDYQRLTGHGDIAILTLKEPVVFGPHIQPLCLWEGNNDLSAIVNGRGTLAVYTRVRTGNGIVLEVTKIDLQIVDPITCARSDNLLAQITSPRTFCAGHPSRPDPCRRDIGNGLAMKINGRWTLRGVVSMVLMNVNDTCDPTKLTVFADTAQYGDWIRNALTTTSNIPTSSISSAVQRGGSSMSIHNQIVDGDTIEEGEFPWMASLMYQLRNIDYKYICRGTLVSNRHVVTAAHCVHSRNVNISSIEDLIVVLGQVNLRNWPLKTVVRGVERYIEHPDYREETCDGDIAIFELKEPVAFGTHIQPLHLWKGYDDLDEIVGDKGTFPVWTRVPAVENVVNDVLFVPKKIDQVITDQITCDKSGYPFAEITSPRTFCAGNRHSLAPCYKDVGVGFAMEIHGKWLLRGVASVVMLKDNVTCDATKYTVFADAAQFTDWLEDICFP
ncbi:hypothetical protein ILUMI_02866 [Ignelater luminosus]|uniref:Peptidase S1 domain-containing protein n=1 Tax=Ignelater luminosus TaxID=2038154 RepID=A0A8K0DHE1_IGNLU|nr:hypothetical protein ILUMI_02866 [Ignelater luminosus]